MAYALGENSYGKAEIRLLHLTRDSERHEVRDLTVGVELRGDFDATYLTGDNGTVLPTDSQKNAVYALAEEHGVGAPEEFALRLARHFAGTQPAVASARVTVAEHPWARTGTTGHSFARSAGESRTATVTVGASEWVVSGLDGLLLLNTTDSEFRGYVKDRYTTLAETGDRVLATAVQADWRHAAARPGEGGWDAAHAAARSALVDTFAGTYSRSLQQTLYAMGEAMLDAVPGIAEVRLRLPNLHHLHVDLTPFGLDNPGVVFHPDDRPYGLITGSVLRDDAPPAGLAW